MSTKFIISKCRLHAIKINRQVYFKYVNGTSGTEHGYTGYILPNMECKEDDINEIIYNIRYVYEFIQ